MKIQRNFDKKALLKGYENLNKDVLDGHNHTYKIMQNTQKRWNNNVPSL